MFPNFKLSRFTFHATHFTFHVSHFTLFTLLYAQQLPFTGKDTSFNSIPRFEMQAHSVKVNTGLSPALSKASVASNNFDVHYYRCEWEIDPATRYITGKVTSSFTTLSAASSVIFDLSEALQVDSVTYHFQKINFNRLPDDGLEIRFPSLLATNQPDSISIYYHGIPRSGVGFGAFNISRHNGMPVMWTLSEPYGAKEWWPCKNGLTDKADSLEIIITCPLAYTPASNGVLLNEVVINDKKITYWKHRYPIASYLVAVALANYVVLEDSISIGNRQMPLIDYAYPEYVPDFRNSTQYTRYSLQLYSRLFGDYPFIKEKYGHTQFEGGGGMEHQTNTFLNYPSLSLVAHESAHQWFGDKITCGSWQDLWLNEGFATYLQLLYNESVDNALLWETLKNFAAIITSSPGGSVWVNDTLDVNRLFSSRLTYYKGSYVLHMLRWISGDSAFFRGIRQYLNDPALNYTFARTTDLQRHLEQATGKNLTSFFGKWFYGEGYPTYSIQWTQDSTNLVHVEISQTTSHPSVPFFDLPVPIQFSNANRDTILIFDHNINAQSFLANPGFQVDRAVFDPHFRILSANNNINKQPCNMVNVDEQLPFYTISWAQNSNGWVTLSIKQINQQATAAGEDIPVYLHFNGIGKDTILLISNIRYGTETLLNLGFKAGDVFATSPSCFMTNRYSVEKTTSNTRFNDIRIYPVPFSGQVFISLKNPTDKLLTIRLFNTAGQLVFKKQVATPGNDELLNIPVAGLPAGLYLINLRSEKTINYLKKILK